ECADAERDHDDERRQRDRELRRSGAAVAQRQCHGVCSAFSTMPCSSDCTLPERITATRTPAIATAAIVTIAYSAVDAPSSSVQMSVMGCPFSRVVAGHPANAGIGVALT